MDKKEILAETDLRRLQQHSLQLLEENKMLKWEKNALEKEIKILLGRLQKAVEALAQATGTGEQQRLQLEIKEINEKLAALSAEPAGKSRSEKRGRPVGEPKEDKAEKQPQKGHGPKQQPLLDQVKQRWELDEADQICPDCGAPLKPMNGQYEASEEVTVIERSYKLITHERQKYHCSPCGHIEAAEGPDRLIPGGRYSTEFAVTVAADKYNLHLPTTRQVDRMAQLGLNVSSQTLWDLLVALYNTLLPSYLALRMWILTQSLVYADETTWRKMGKGSSEKWWVWAICTETAVFYEILPTRSTAAAAKILGSYEGIVMADGYGAYAALEEARQKGGKQLPMNGSQLPPLPNYMLAICWAHARRPLFKGEKNFPEGGEALDLIAKLYAIEAEAENGPVDTLLKRRKELRNTKPRDVIAQLNVWEKKQHPLPGSTLAEGVSFLRNQWKGLTRFLEDPQIPLDNNHAEQQMRQIVLGRNVHLGSRATLGCQVSALFYSLINSAKLVGVDPQKYLLEAANRAIRDPGTVTFPWDLLKP